MERDQLLPGEPDPGGPHDVHPQLYPLLHFHARQVLHSVLHSKDKEAARKRGVLNGVDRAHKRCSHHVPV